MRKIRGFDFLVVLVGADLQPSLLTTNVKLRPCDVQETYGANAIVFIGNKNAHCLPKRCSGVVCYIDAYKAVFVLLAAIGPNGVGMVLFPLQFKGAIMPINLCHFAVSLQQVNGPCAGFINTKYRFKTISNGSVLPLLDKMGYIKSNTNGGDIHGNLPMIPSTYRNFLRERWITRNEMRILRACDETVPTIYICLMDGWNTRYVPTDEGRFAVPIGPKLLPGRNSSLYYYQEFANVTASTIVGLHGRHWMSKQEADSYFRKHATSTQLLLVPKIHKEQRIKIVSYEQYRWICSQREVVCLDKGDSIRGLEGQGYVKFAFGSEPRNLNHKDSPGILVSYWANDERVTRTRVTYNFALAVIGTFGRGYGNRGRANNFGCNAYRSKRYSRRPFPSPFIAEEDIPYHQYYNGNQNMVLLQGYLEKQILNLRHYLNSVASDANPHVIRLVTPYLIRGIITSGFVPRPKKKHPKTFDYGESLPTSWSRNPTYGFACELHVDECDVPLNNKRREWALLAQERSWSYVQQFMESDYFGLPTTCGYQFTFKDPSASRRLQPIQYFALDGLGMAVQLQDGIAHHFFGSAFAHRTCLPYCQRVDDNMVSFFNDDNDVLIFAWGSTDSGNQIAEADNETDESHNGNHHGNDGPVEYWPPWIEAAYQDDSSGDENLAYVVPDHEWNPNVI